MLIIACAFGFTLLYVHYINQFLTDIFTRQKIISVEAEPWCENKLTINLRRLALKLTRVDDQLYLISVRRNSRTLYSDFDDSLITFELHEEENGTWVIVKGERLRFLENEQVKNINNRCNAKVKICHRNFLSFHCEVFS